MRASKAFNRKIKGSPYGSDLEEKHGNNRNDKKSIKAIMDDAEKAKKEAQRKDATNDKKDILEQA
tara:strand:+ start:128 stop:322 length:195 start_codon:yes stop_codon:yes gene_type:complete